MESFNSLNYADHINDLLQRTKIKKSKVFFYNDTHYSGACKTLFNYFQKSFDKDFGYFNITPASFYFSTEQDINAHAANYPNSNVVCINIGAVKGLAELFLQDFKVISKSSNSLNLLKLEGLIKDDFNNILLQASLIFLFYHEVGHLVQLSESEIKNFRIEYNEDEGYTAENHIMEIDADIFSAIQLSRHAIIYLKRLPKEERTLDNLTSIISLLCAGSGFFMLQDINFSNEVYTTEKSHPHSLIRLFIIIDTVINYSFKVLGISNTEMKERASAVKKTIELIDDLMPILMTSAERTELMQIYRNSEKEIFDYAKELIEFVLLYENGAVHKFKQYANSLGNS